MKHLTFFKLFLFCFLVTVTPLQAEILSLSKEQKAYPAGLHLQVLEDSSQVYTLESVQTEEIQKIFTPSETLTPAHGFTSSAYWAKLTIQSSLDVPSEWIMEFGYPLLDSLVVYIPDENGSYQEHATGDRTVFATREIQFHNFAFPIHMTPRETKTIYVRMATESSMKFPVTIHSSQGFTEVVNTKMYIYGLYYGIMFAMLVYNLFIYMASKDISYLHYVLFILFFSVFQMALHGLSLEYLWPESIWWGNTSVPLLEALSLIFSLTFAQNFLNTKALQPKLHKFMNIVLILLGISMIASLFSYSLGIKMGTALAVVSIISIGSAGIKGYRQGYRPARFYLLAWSAFMLGAIAYALAAFGVLPSNALTENFLLVGSSLEVLLLSLGLADRINEMRKEKYLAEKEARKASQEALEHLEKADQLKEENLRITREQNQILELKVHERTVAIRDLLNNTGQGFLTFGADHLIQPEYSQACRTFFGKELAGVDAIKTLTAACETHTDAEVREIADMLLTGQSPMMLVELLLPKELRTEDRVLSIEWKFIEPEDSADEAEVKLMVILTDITQEVKLAEQIKTDEERQNIIVKVATDKTGFIRFLSEIDELFKSSYQLLSGSIKDFDANALFRNFHTIKGGAASYGMKKVAAQAHEVENLLSPVQAGSEEYTKELQEALNTGTHEIEKMLQSTLTDLNDIIPPEERSDTSVFYRVSSEKILKLESFMMKKIGQDHLNLIKKEIEHLLAQPIAPLLRKYATSAEELGVKIGKEVHVDIKGGNIEVPYQKLENFFSTFVHLVRNSVDHGLEDTGDRQMLGKPGAGQITLEAKEKDGNLTLLVQDDGKGIDAKQIAEIAVQKKMITEEQAKTMKEGEALALIFEPGFSTKLEVTEISGRGVGMDAVRSAVKELKGKITIQTKLDQGTTFAIDIPLAAS